MITDILLGLYLFIAVVVFEVTDGEPFVGSIGRAIISLLWLPVLVVVGVSVAIEWMTREKND